ncbi:MAG TPA: hypothetical protein VK399_12360 [Longimicrobiaceae bacterium]|nr:hypothetical protein [Longimicrobiaceae bacterium]
MHTRSIPRALPRFLRSALAPCALVLAMAAAGAPIAQGMALDPGQLVGRWRVDLRPTPGAPAYFQSFVVRSVEGSTFRGTFYGSELQNGSINTDWGAVRFAFTTQDGSGVYHHTGVLRDGALEGTSHSLGRRFLAVWSAKPGE